MSITVHNSPLRGSQGSLLGRWPPPSQVAYSLASPKHITGYGSERDSETPTTTRTPAQMCPQPPNPRLQQLPLPDTNDPDFPEAQTNQDIQCRREDALQYLERQKANIPNIGKRVKIAARQGADAIKDGIVEGQVGYVLGKFAVEHDLANIPRLPEHALLGVAEDEYHSRDSYVEICNQALEHARRELKKGKRPIIFAPPDSDDDNAPGSPLRRTCPAMPVQPATEGSDAYMHLLDDPPVLPHKKFISAPAALETQKVRLAERWQRANEHNVGRDNLYKAGTLDRHPTALRPGRESRDTRTASWKIEPVPEEEGTLPALSNGDDDISTPNMQKPHRHPTALRPQYPSRNTGTPRGALARTDSGRPVTLVAREIKRSWDSADVQAPRTPTTPDGMIYRQLSHNSKRNSKQKKVRRGTTIFGPSEIAAVSDVMARIEKMPEEPVDKPVEAAPTIPMSAVSVARLKQMGRKPTEPVKTIVLNPQARTWEGQAQPRPEAPTIRRIHGAAALNPQAKTWETNVQPAQQAAGPSAPLNPQAKTWDSKPLPPIGVPIKKRPAEQESTAAVAAAPLNPQAKTWESQPLPQIGVPIKRKPVPQTSTSPTSATANAAFATQIQQVNVARTLSQFHRQTRAAPAPTNAPVKFGDTHLEDPAVQHVERARLQRKIPVR